MDFFSIGDEINVKDYNSLVYLLRKFKRLNTGLKLGALTLTSDYGSFTFDKALTSVGGNFIIEQEVNVSSSDCLRNCFYSFVFSVIDVNTSGTVNKRTVKVTGGTGDDGSLFLTLPTDLIESDEVILPNFELDIVFDEHEYYTPVVDVVNVELVSDKRFVGVGEVATVTATLSDRDGELLIGVPCTFNVNGQSYSRTTDENGQAEYQYTGTGVSSKIDIRVVTERLTIYDSVMTATVTGDRVRLGQNMIATGHILIDWGDGTTTIRRTNWPIHSSHTYTDGLNEHTIAFIGEITNLGDYCFDSCTGLTSITLLDSVTSLGNYCFYGCTGLTSITLLDSVTSLGERCFGRCTGLTSVTIPNTVINMGDYCFYNCPIVDYQLYWKDTVIIEYESTIMPVKSNTYFTIPQGQRTQYLNKHYPNKIKIRGYDLSLSTDKTIIETDETSTVTATLTYNMEPISDETVSYTIRQGSTIIDTGTDTTDSNGQIEIEYTGTSAGKINIIFTYDTLTETTTIIDSIFHDPATSTDYNTNWKNYNNRLTVSRDTSGTLLTPNSANNGYWISTRSPPTEFIVEFDVLSINGNVYLAYTSNNHVRLDNRVQAGDNVRIEYTDGVNKVYVNNVLKATVNQSADSYIGFQLYAGSSFKYGDYVLYGVSGSDKVDTSISLSSDKASYYTDESILLTGTLVDDDSLPLVNASVKVYRGASLVDTVSTDSNGEYEKTVTGLSAGSYSFKAVYDGDETYASSTSSTVSVIVQNHSYSLSISSDKQIILTTESVTISGTLLKDSTAFSSQSVDLYDGVTKIATLTTDGTGEYEETVSGLSVGVHTFKAVNTNAESSTISITVNEPTHVYALSASANPSTTTYGNDVTVSGAYTVDGTGVSGETITIYDGDTVLGTTTTGTGGAYSKTISGLNVGSHTLKASHTNVDSSTVSVTINKITTTTTISASSSSILTTDSLILSGSITGATTGTVKIYNNGTLIATETVSSGTYSKTLTGLAAGSYSFYTVFQEDSTHASSTSTSVSVTVSEPAPVHDYSLSVASSKDILSYADSESATITATLLDNSVAVAGETLSYVIKHGTTTIDSGSDTTDSSGQITFNYSATGIGDVDLIVSYGSLLQETYALEDTLFYDPLTSNSGHYTSSVSGATARINEYSENGWKVGYGTTYHRYICDYVPQFPYEVSFEIKDKGSSYDNAMFVANGSLVNFGSGNNSIQIRTSSYSTHSVSVIGKWTVKVYSNKFEVYRNDVYIGERTHSNPTPSIEIECGGQSGRYMQLKDLKIKAL